MDGRTDRTNNNIFDLKNADIIMLHGFSFKVGMPWKLTVSE